MPARLHQIHFTSHNRLEWLRKIQAVYRIPLIPGDIISLFFSGIRRDKIQPEHIVTLACLVEHIVRNNATVRVNTKSDIGKYLIEKLRFHDYWNRKQTYIKSEDDSILNLWHFNRHEMDIHAKRIREYLNNTFFRHKDLIAVEISLAEAYYNINDHAEANGNAFSMVYYDEHTETLSVAVCDFGIGIPTSIRRACPEITDDTAALRKAMEYKFTVGSTGHNAGMGLNNIKSSCTQNDYLWIVSNRAILVVGDGLERVFDLGFNFAGTLIMYGLSLSHFENTEIINDFTW